MKRIISLLLVLALLTGNLAPAAAVEMQETTAPTEETVLETTEVTVPAEEETVSAVTTVETEAAETILSDEVLTVQTEETVTVTEDETEPNETQPYEIEESIHSTVVLSTSEPVEVKRMYYDNHLYVLYDNSMTWTEAKTYCEKLGGYLVTITSAEEQAFIETFLPEPYTKRQYWIGATSESGVWVWVTGENFNYTNWDANQPDTNGGSEHYAQIHNYTSGVGNYPTTRYRWNDAIVDNNYNSSVYSTETVGFICEYSVLDFDTDTDGDGLPDIWEVNGADLDGDGTVDLHLDQMGADPNVPDIFVEVDWMQTEYKENKFLWWTVSTQNAVNLKPNQAALDMVAEQFANHGYNLHIDAGSNSVDYVTGERWGALSGGNAVEYRENMPTGIFDWRWNSLVSNNFSDNRATIFRHCLFINTYDGTRSSGLANDIPGQYFLVADVDGCLRGKGDTAIASTFMHELGHTLGLSHGGITLSGNNDHTHYKPNYLSIMNYLFQIDGLVNTSGSAVINYSDYSLPELNETNLNENSGVDPNGVTAGSGLGTKWYYNGIQATQQNVAGAAIDFNLNGRNTDTGVSVNLNNNKETVLASAARDWDHIVIQGGAIGDHGVEIDPDNMVVINEEIMNADTELSWDKALEDGLLGELYDCEIDSVSPGVLYAGVPDQVLSVVIQNLYPADTTPRLFVTSDLLNETYEEYVSVASIKSSTVEIPVAENLEPGTYTVKYELVSESGLYDTLTVNVEVAEVQTVEICAGDSKDLIPDEAVKALNIAWESSDEAVVTIENGIATAISVGKAYVSGRMENGEVLVCLVEVKKSYDVNGDTLVDEADISQLVWHLLFAETFPLTNDADFDCDGDVDLSDAADLLWRVLFPVTQ